ncbi:MULTISPECIES: response regulator transcription factor [Peribacillus]|uniref:response regulator transcription factor n=1 Tax=Peribacillus TaxID=2675229 RepID=UPI001913AAD7|nr:MULTISPECIES: response regulator transcription factor [unclassified Peribacillus]MBK5444426.1 response regulator transcription factor [Peribacillus sp. TH24]MBK5460870.1 response regulator transcription factor [Peribacillus sp. TH27]MBK5485816.1 response regulator transcription factor [Peribacillus sp. TH16]MBK5499012.1 response regulator transcription factor [Peribacillus sp. TH14]WMX55893.1 response regulator transcription factor [Peribacillus sp. R9-11]
MYNVFLVDDEPFIIEGMRALVPWEDYGLKVVGEASNGSEAIKKLETCHVDILLTDIMMPIMDGLELISTLKERHPNTKYIVLSGYEEFEYVKKGMKLGIENYLLKPVNEQELISTLENSIEKLEKSTNNEEAYTILRDNTIWRCLNQDIDAKEWRERVELYSLEFDGQNLAVVLMQISDGEHENSSFFRKRVEELFQSVCIINPDGELILLVSFNCEDGLKKKLDELNMLFAGYVSGKYHINVGSFVCSTSELYKSYQRAKELSSYRLVLKESGLITDELTKQYTQASLSTSNELDDLKRYIVGSEQEKAFLWIKGAFDEINKSTKKVAPTIIRGFAIEIVTSIQKDVSSHANDQTVGIVKRILEAYSIGILVDILIDFIEGIFRTLEQKPEHRSPIIQSVVQYIQEHFYEELSLKTLSYKFHINSIYLGQLFQKETGLVFSEYINHLRLEKAKQLLRGTHLKAGIIGKQVGYSDSAYFYKQFKKAVGITPSAWRTMNIKS